MFTLKMTPQRCLIVVTLALYTGSASAEVRLASWNVLNGGWENGKSMPMVAHIAGHFDFLALQEVMDEAFMHELEAHLEAASGEPWSWMASHALGDSTYREKYAFLYRDTAIAYDRGAVVFIDQLDAFSRDPYSAQFRSRLSGREFAVANVHITYGSSVGDRLPEIQALADYWGWLEETYEGVPVLLMGDFNLDPEHAGWTPIREKGVIPVITEGATTLGTQDGVWSNLYDNIWKAEGQWEIKERGILAYPEMLSLGHEEARAQVSDHAPVYITLGGATVTPTHMTNVPRVDMNADACVDLNEADPHQLEQLPNVGPVRSEDIVMGRPWGHPRDLEQIRGLGAASIDAIEDSGLLCP